MEKFSCKLLPIGLMMAIVLVFLNSCNDDDTEPVFTTVSDIEGNVYRTVVIGGQEWMAENLRVSRYNNGDLIPTGLSNEDWGETTEGAYAIYPHEGGSWDDDPVEDINSDDEMLAAYGILYNWYAVDDERGLCPDGWSVPGDDDWSQLVTYLMEQYGLHNHWGISDIDGAGNALKSCRQVNSPRGGSCNTSKNPRWNAHSTHHGMDEFGLSLLPGGSRTQWGDFFLIGISGYWWSADEHSTNFAWSREASMDVGNISQYFPHKSSGFSIRCIKD